jgi:hypothetical protein
MVPGVSGGGECLNVSDIDMVQADAKLYDRGALLTWSTASESENLGFNIYRSRDGVRERINPGLVAGSALKTTANMRAGYSYVWWDPDATASSQYWIEDVGFRGTGTMYAPEHHPSRRVPPRSAASKQRTRSRRAAKSSGPTT